MDEVINYIEKNNNEEFKKEIESLDTFRFDIDFRGLSETREKELEMINKFDKFNFKAKVDINNAQRIFVIFRNTVENQKTKEIISTKYFFGRQMSGKDEKKLRFYTKYVLTKRKYIGPTATDHLLSFLMANFAQIKQGQLIIDPFVGTGSLLIPPSYYKAQCFGCDLDVRVLRGYSVGYTRKSENDKTPQKMQGNIFSNFDDYGFPRPQIIRQDINKPAFRKKNLLFDAIVCDPPYGWRAGVRKTGLSDTKKEKREKRLEQKRKNKKSNNNEDIKDDEDIKEEKDEEDLVNHPINFPRHPQFKLINPSKILFTEV